MNHIHDPVDIDLRNWEAEQGRDAEFDARAEKGFAQADADADDRIFIAKMNGARGVLNCLFPQRSPEQIAQQKRLLAAALANLEKMKPRGNA